MVVRNGNKVEDAQQYWLDTFNVGDSWRLFRIMAEFVEGFDSLAAVKRPAVSIFGSARFDENHEYYKVARAVGKGLSEAGYAIMTGGGPGIMEAGNRGAADADGISIGLNIDLPFEQEETPMPTCPSSSNTSLSARSCWLSMPWPLSPCRAASAPWMNSLRPSP